MLSPRNAQIIAVLLTVSFLITTPFQATRAQTGASKQQDPPPPAGLKPTVDKQTTKPEADDGDR